MNHVPARKGSVVVHEHRTFYSEANYQRQAVESYRICIVDSANVSGHVMKLRDAASGAVVSTSLIDRYFVASDVPADAVKRALAGASDAVVDSLDEAKALLRALRGPRSTCSPAGRCSQRSRSSATTSRHGKELIDMSIKRNGRTYCAEPARETDPMATTNTNLTRDLAEALEYAERDRLERELRALRARCERLEAALQTESWRTPVALSAPRSRRTVAGR